MQYVSGRMQNLTKYSVKSEAEVNGEVVEECTYGDGKVAGEVKDAGSRVGEKNSDDEEEPGGDEPGHIPADPDSGTYGGIEWSIDDSGMLTLKGTASVQRRLR